MKDVGRPYSITFQCDDNPTFEKFHENKGIATGCGHAFASAYFMSFQIIVSMIFLNLFIAILIDCYVGTTEAFNLPVKNYEFDIFIEYWSKFDPKATGYIALN